MHRSHWELCIFCIPLPLHPLPGWFSRSWEQAGEGKICTGSVRSPPQWQSVVRNESVVPMKLCATWVSYDNWWCKSQISAMFSAEKMLRTTLLQTLPLKPLQQWACDYWFFCLLPTDPQQSETFSAYLCIPQSVTESLAQTWWWMSTVKTTNLEERWRWFWNHDIWAEFEGTSGCWSWRRIKRRGMSAVIKYMRTLW